MIRLFHFAALALVSVASIASRQIWSVLRRADRSWHVEIGKELARFAERSGPATIKLAQLLSSRGDVLPEGVLEGLRSVQDHVTSPSHDIVRDWFEESYGPLDQAPLLVTSWTPIAAGSIAVVLDGRTPDGTRVAIKIVRARVWQELDSDLRLIARVLGTLEKLPFLRPYPLSTVLKHLSPMILNQADMVQESNNAARLERALRELAIVPVPIACLTRPRAMAMSLVTEYQRFCDKPDREKYKDACVKLLHSVYEMIFKVGVVHCDLHPGNLGIASDGTPVLFDYGLVAVLTDEDREIFRGLFVAIAARNGRRATREILRTASHVPADLDLEMFEKDVDVVVQRWTGKPAGDFLVAGLVKDLFQIQYRHRIQSVPGFVAAICALASFEGLVRVKFPELDFQGEALSYLSSEAHH